jgi:pyruvate kinase
VNVPGVVLPLPALTAKDLRDLRLALELGADWIALSFVQRPEDLVQARALIGERAGIVTKLEKPSAIARLDEILALTDAAMVARGDLGVELAAEEVPAIQKRIVRACRAQGKPVIVATQMLESMIHSPVPTRAETSDVAGAVYEGADAVMLSAETAAGRYPLEAVAVMDRVIARVEKDPAYREGLDEPVSRATGEGASEVICAAAARSAALLPAAAIVCYTTSGSTALRVARERPVAPILALAPSQAVARKLSLGWGIHAMRLAESPGEKGLLACAARIAAQGSFGTPGENVVAIAGAPFGRVGSTNFMGVGTLSQPTSELPIG